MKKDWKKKTKINRGKEREEKKEKNQTCKNWKPTKENGKKKRKKCICKDRKLMN